MILFVYDIKHELEARFCFQSSLFVLYSSFEEETDDQTMMIKTRRKKKFSFCFLCKCALKSIKNSANVPLFFSINNYNQ
jgi:hypothetical protein